ncbi:Sec-independent protein translocase protein TatB [Aminobacter anthyllidis]|uniref:Sec-independent protein translocase protein TatB n=1 Tax=Aminobacter anthyllidis TaxID=1035067 RepID=UPI0024575147|nr:Sec-independent protein translocase protein TatB [Aminobacter anthyllidis]MDH4985135.1 Sec-independent protein translocase protein TatB [Aminobacter anthyllidis]
MFEIGWTEMLVIAVVMIVVVGPKDLPKMLRTIGRMTTKARSMAGDFQRQFNEALKEAELDDVKKSVDELRSLNPANEIRKQLNPFEKAAADVRAGLDTAMKPKSATTPAEPASDVTHPAEPLKNGATVMPGVAGPETMPAAPVFPAAEVKATPVPAAAMVDKPKATTKPKATPEAKPAAKASVAPAKAKASVAPAKAAVAKTVPAKAAAPKKTVAAKATKAGKAS